MRMERLNWNSCRGTSTAAMMPSDAHSQTKDQAIKPTAHDIEKAFTRHCINGRLGFSQLRFKFTGLDREDEQSTIDILQKRYKTNSITSNEIRDRFGEKPMTSQWGDLTCADVEVAMAAARSAAQVDDADLPGAKPGVSTKQSPAAGKKPQQTS